MSTISDEKPPKADTRGFLPIAIDTLVPTSTLDFDLFIRPERAGPVLMFRERSYPLEGEDLERQDWSYRTGHALVNPLQLRESLNLLSNGT